MALFSNHKNERSDSRDAMTLVGDEAYFHGVLAVKGSLRVDGVVEGDITDALSVEIGKKGRIRGNVAAETLSIAGQIDGDVVASRSVEILAQGRLSGNIRTPNLRIEDGAYFDGSCAMTAVPELQSTPGNPGAAFLAASKSQ